MNTPTVYLAATGQTTSTPSSTTPTTEGMDGAVQAGIKIDDSQRFESGTGTQANCITDKLTGLMWVRDLSKINGGQPTTWQDALYVITNANKTKEFCGYNDWHLPTVNELYSLLNYSMQSSSSWLNTLGFANVEQQSLSYWSSTTYTSNPALAVPPCFTFWQDSANQNTAISGAFGGSYKYVSIGVWAVRRTPSADNAQAKIPKTGETTDVAAGSESGVAWPDPRFIEGHGASDNCVTDKLTGLMWVKDLNTVKIKGAKDGESTTWQNAIDSVKQANVNDGGYCGYTDWRLPNLTELRSMLNYGQANPSTWLNNQRFSNVREALYWSSTRYTFPAGNVPGSYVGWNISFSGGRIDPSHRSGNPHVWPVRGGRRPRP